MPKIKNLLRSFGQQKRYSLKKIKKTIGLLEKKSPPKLYQKNAHFEQEVWKNMDCLNCANCCKKMTPNYTLKEIKQIARYLNMSEKMFREKYLYQEKKSKDWVNKQQPCAFLDKQTNFCTIYPLRPNACKGFPHLNKKPFADYLFMYKKNISYCPATFLMLQKIEAYANDKL